MTLPKIKKTNTGNKSKAAARILRALLCFAFWIGIWYIAAAALGKAVFNWVVVQWLVFKDLMLWQFK